MHLHRIDHDRNMARFYSMQVQKTLFGEWTLFREWGRIGSAGQRKAEAFASEAEAAIALATSAAVKVRRGYHSATRRSRDHDKHRTSDQGCTRFAWPNPA